MKIWWCQEHNACWVPGDDESPADPGDACLYWYWTTDARHVETGYSPPLRDCRMVPMRLIPDNEETVERIAEAIHSKDEGSYVGDWSKLAEWRKEEYRQWAVPVLVALVGETP